MVIPGKRTGPGDVIGVDIDNRGFRIDSRAAPLRTSIETREDHRVFAHGERKKLALIAEGAEFFERPLVNLWSAIGKKIFRQGLPRERSGLGGKTLLRGGNFTRHVAGRIRMIVNWEKRSTQGAIEQIDETLLGSLRNGVNFLAIAGYGEQD